MKNKSNRIILVCIALLLTVSVSMISWIVCYRSSYKLVYEELEFSDIQYKNNTLTFKVTTKLDGEFVYSYSTSMDGKQLVVNFRGGKTAKLAEGKTVPVTVTVPEGVKTIKCRNVKNRFTTIHTVSSK